MARSNKKNTKSPPARRKVPPAVMQSTKPAKPLFRLIPLTMAMAGGLLALKTVEIYQTGRSLHEELFVSTVIAQDTPAVTPAATPPAAPAAVPVAASAPQQATTRPTRADAPRDFFDERADSTSYSRREIDVLENLAERREKLDKLERDLALREKVLKATEARIDDKITEMNSMSEALKKLLVAYDEEENAKIASLVKVYEAMKPKDAARIFDELDMDILLMVVSRMSERRIAPVLAEMSPRKAKDVTQQLADQQRRKPDTLNAVEEQLYSPPLF